MKYIITGFRSLLYYYQIVFYLLEISMLLYGKPVADKLEEQVKNYVLQHELQNKYVGILMVGTDHP